MKDKILWTFNWKQGGFNSVWAGSRRLALEQIKKEFPNSDPSVCQLDVDETTLTPRRTKEEQNAYWDNIPLMD